MFTFQTKQTHNVHDVSVSVQDGRHVIIRRVDRRVDYIITALLNGPEGGYSSATKIAQAMNVRYAASGVSYTRSDVYYTLVRMRDADGLVDYVEGKWTARRNVREAFARAQKQDRTKK